MQAYEKFGQALDAYKSADINTWMQAKVDFKELFPTLTIRPPHRSANSFWVELTPGDGFARFMLNKPGTRVRDPELTRLAFYAVCGLAVAAEVTSLGLTAEQRECLDVQWHEAMRIFGPGRAYG